MSSVRKMVGEIFGNVAESVGTGSNNNNAQLIRPNKKDEGRKPTLDVGLLEIQKLASDPNQPRKEFDQDSIQRLAQSIKEKGQLQPIRVRWDETLGKWVIISGERRYRACKLAGLQTVSCIFVEWHLADADLLQDQLIENCLREDLRPIEQALAFQILMNKKNWTAKQLTQALRLSPAAVSRALSLLRLPEDIQRQVNDGTILPNTAYELSKLKDNRACRELAKKAASGAFTYNDTAKAVRQRKGNTPKKARGTSVTFRQPNGWKVVVTANRKGGTDADIRAALLAALHEIEASIATEDTQKAA